MDELPLFSAAASGAANAFAERIQAAQADAGPLVRKLASLCFQSAAEGHSCLDASALLAERNAGEAALPPLAELFAGNRLVASADGPHREIGPCLMVVFGTRLYLKKYWSLETRLFSALLGRSDSRQIALDAEISRRLADSCLEKPLTLLTGGPGTGKTTAIASALVQWMEQFHHRHHRIPKVLLCAPTGKAASRMNESWQRQRPSLLQNLDAALHSAVPESAQTLHRLLAIHPHTRASRFSRNQPLQADLLVFDEASMLDLPMAMLLFDALPDSCHLLFVGDPEQLPSIETGSVLRTMLTLPASSALQQAIATAHIHLDRNYRQADAPGLSALASDLLRAEPEMVVAGLTGGGYPGADLQAHSSGAVSALVDRAVEHYRSIAAQSRVEDAMALLSRRIILSPLREGPNGCNALNARIGDRLHVHGNRHGQVLMITENAPALGLSNGDIGLVWKQAQGVQVFFPRQDGPHGMPPALLPAHELAYALTVHKAQGSEFDHVDLLLPDTDTPLLSRALVYTACTRARTSLSLTAAPDVLAAALRRNINRMSGLADFAPST